MHVKVLFALPKLAFSALTSFCMKTYFNSFNKELVTRVHSAQSVNAMKNKHFYISVSKACKFEKKKPRSGSDNFLTDCL